jgi:hypothetical protein
MRDAIRKRLLVGAAHAELLRVRNEAQERQLRDALAAMGDHATATLVKLLPAARRGDAEALAVARLAILGRARARQDERGP